MHKIVTTIMIVEHKLARTTTIQSAALLKVMHLHRCFSRFLECANDLKLCKALPVIISMDTRMQL